MDLIFHNHLLQQKSALKSVLWTYNQIRYGLKFYLWSTKDKKGVYAYYKDNGLMEQYRIAPNRRQEDGSYKSDGSGFNWDRFNIDIWKVFSEDYDSKTDPTILGLKTVKEVQEQKTKLLLYFLENYAHKVNLEFKSTPMNPKTPIVDDDGISITLLSRSPEFSIKSPNGAISLVISKTNKGLFVTTIKDNCDRPSIQIPQLGLPLFERMFHYANIITSKPTDVINNPHYHLGLDVNIERQFQSAQEFLLEQNKLALARRQEQKAKYEPKSLSHDNFSDKPKTTSADKVIMTPSKDNTKITKEVTVNYHTDKSTEPLYQWDYIHSENIHGDIKHYYGIPKLDFLDWIEDYGDGFLRWSEDERIFIVINNQLLTVDAQEYMDEIWTTDGSYFAIDVIEFFYLEEIDFQIYKNLHTT
ncbi:hypothetical protein VKI21_02230 [Cyanobacterium aponinum UTEX 3222]|uniref:hypothetical protein n=1 Tax=Cyanobacterium aponinum TaxID=379064 RepID=UPI0030859FD6|nr:hypothetical protein VKI21_02230 [Cyanobacterium aponinum UTEX 3222]